MRHTPGPWTVLDDKRTGISVRSEDSEYSVCSLSIAAVHERSPSVARANARLIAAAPDLLRVCEMMLSGDYTRLVPMQIAEAARAAIAKASRP